MDYRSTDKPYPRGEICIRGHAVMREYYKNPEKTAETIDADGWLHTGDIGVFDDANRVRIIDRLKNIFKLSQVSIGVENISKDIFCLTYRRQGEYIAPEKIEGVYQKHELVAQAFVYGDSLQPCLVGIIVPDKDALLAWAAEKSEFAKLSADELCNSPDVKKAILKILNDHGKENDLKGFEQVKNIHLTMKEFSIENDMLTPTFKLKREVAQKVYSEQIKELYAALSNGRAFN